MEINHVDPGTAICGLDVANGINREELFLVSSLNPSHSRHSMPDLSIEEADTDVVLCFDLP